MTAANPTPVGLRVLLVDNDPIYRATFAQQLRVAAASLSFPLDVAVASDGERALVLIHTNHPHVVFARVKMSPITGGHIARSLNEATELPFAPRLYLFEAWAALGDVASLVGTQPVQPKPLDLAWVVARLEEAFTTFASLALTPAPLDTALDGSASDLTAEGGDHVSS